MVVVHCDGAGGCGCEQGWREGRFDQGWEKAAGEARALFRDPLVLRHRAMPLSVIDRMRHSVSFAAALARRRAQAHSCANFCERRIAFVLRMHNGQHIYCLYRAFQVIIASAVEYNGVRHPPIRSAPWTLPPLHKRDKPRRKLGASSSVGALPCPRACHARCPHRRFRSRVFRCTRDPRRVHVHASHALGANFWYAV